MFPEFARLPEKAPEIKSRPSTFITLVAVVALAAVVALGAVVAMIQRAKQQRMVNPIKKANNVKLKSVFIETQSTPADCRF
jgi:flagellar basal body-associated protein FliL